jgi:acyl-CoA thioesterase
MEKMKEFFKKDKFAEHCGIELVESAKGYCKVKMEIASNHLNGVGTVHGGAIFTLAAAAFAVAGNSHGTVAVGINVNISFIRAINKGTLVADAKETSINPKIATYEVRVTDNEGNLIAIFGGMAYRKNMKLEDIK